MLTLEVVEMPGRQFAVTVNGDRISGLNAGDAIALARVAITEAAQSNEERGDSEYESAHP